jgi:hypothetical protein
LTHHLALAKQSSNTQAQVLSLLELLALVKCLLLVVVVVVARLSVAVVVQVDTFTTHLQFFHQEL